MRLLVWGFILFPELTIHVLGAVDILIGEFDIHLLRVYNIAMCGTTYRYEIPNSERGESGLVGMLANAVEYVPECTVAINASGNKLSAVVEGTCAVEFNSRGEIISGRCMRRTLRSLGIGNQLGQKCPRQ